jgi:hypothetical protein
MAAIPGIRTVRHRHWFSQVSERSIPHAFTEHCGFANKIAVKFFPQFSSGTWRQVQNDRAVVHLSFDSERWLGCPTHANSWFKTSGSLTTCGLLSIREGPLCPDPMVMAVVMGGGHRGGAVTIMDGDAIAAVTTAGRAVVVAVGMRPDVRRGRAGASI